MSQNIKKKFINSAETSVLDAVKGIVDSNENLRIHQNNFHVVLRNDLDQLKSKNIVTLISGGGSGHEPFAAGYVGSNGLSAAVCGDIFSSPTSNWVSDGINEICGEGGTIVYVLNYTGDRLHFGMAVERARSNNSSRVELIFIDDDVSLEANLNNSITGRRGLAGAAIVLQIAGVLAEKFGKKYEEIIEISREIIRNLRTFGVSLYPCALPGQTLKEHENLKNKITYGLGIHNEAGSEECEYKSVNEVVSDILTRLTKSQGLKDTKEEIVVLINNLGSVCQLEMSIIQREVISWLNTKGFKIECLLVGTLVTSLDGLGFSITILRLKDPLWIQCLETNSAISSNWKLTKPSKKVLGNEPKSRNEGVLSSFKSGYIVSNDIANLNRRCLQKACDILLEKENLLNNLDSECGDGDCGTSFKSAVIFIQKSFKELNFAQPKSLFLQLSKIFEDSVGGTSGAIYALLLASGAKCFDNSASLEDLKRAWAIGLDTIKRTLGTQPGHRTMVDPLNTAVIENDKELEEIVKKVEESAQKTAEMRAKAGRASYTSAKQQTQPDAGAIALALIFRAIFDEYSK